jgi:hypothetical protein
MIILCLSFFLCQVWVKKQKTPGWIPPGARVWYNGFSHPADYPGGFGQNTVSVRCACRIRFIN